LKNTKTTDKILHEKEKGTAEESREKLERTRLGARWGVRGGWGKKKPRNMEGAR